MTEKVFHEGTRAEVRIHRSESGYVVTIPDEADLDASPYPSLDETT